ncbi:hypothetical protein [Carboxylicivirga marina]|uniref:Uncharacterized protein n=1 Tax=Carboxylicivirga marina TaxID=2800988 RepID=A0ABS1HLQ1_9BACT|nr:hypothetical protein [Carboxylicivirga marina]MBK3518613.1 hypothetical protein [Carboxylicivirga marina]
MEADNYKKIIEQLRQQKPQLENGQKLKHEVMNRIRTQKSVSNIAYLIRVAASILILLSLGAYAWMEIYTWENRLAIEQRVSPNELQNNVDWQCRQTVNEIVASLFETNALVRQNDGVLINKSNMKLLEVENAELFARVSDMLERIKLISPNDFQTYQSGEDIHLNAWQLRREYGFCEWITK